MSGFERIKSATNRAAVQQLPASADPSELFVARDGSDVRLFDVDRKTFTTIEPPGLSRNEVVRGLHSYFPLTSDVTDETGSHNGTTNDAPSFDASNGVQFSTSADKVNLGEDASNAFVGDGEDFTLAFWYTPKTTNTSNTDKQVLSTAGGNPLKILQNDSTLKAETDNGSANYTTVSSNTRIYVTVTHTSKEITLYIDGVNEGTASFSSNVTGGIMLAGSGLSNGEFIRDLGLWDRVLTHKEIKALYNEGSPGHDFLQKLWHNYPAQQDVNFKENRVIRLGAPLNPSDAARQQDLNVQSSRPQLLRDAHAYYSFDDSSNRYLDSIGINDGTPQGSGNISSSTSIIGDAFDTQGNDAYVDVGEGLGWTDNDFTVSMWVKPIQENANVIFLENGDTSTARTQISFLSSGNTDNTHRFSVDTNGTTMETSNEFAANTWYHVVITRTGSNGNIYVNRSHKVAGNTDNGDIGQTDVGRIGSAKTSTSADVVIDEVGVWYRVLSANEVEYLYNNGSGTNDFASFGWYSRAAQSKVYMKSHPITGVGLDVDDNTAAISRKYLEGDNMKGNISMKDDSTNPDTYHTITDLKDASNVRDALTINKANTVYLRLDGTNSMENSLSMDDGSGPYKITDLRVATAYTDALSREYLEGSNMKGDISMKDDSTNPDTYHTITDLKDASSNRDALTMNKANNVYLRLDGTKSMGGSLSMDDGSGPYKITDLKVATNSRDALSREYLEGNKMKGNISMKDAENNTNRAITKLANASNNRDAVNRQTGDSRFLRLNGDNSMNSDLDMSGNKIININGTNDTKFEAANEKYVQDYVSNNAGNASGWATYPATADVDMNGNNIEKHGITKTDKTWFIASQNTLLRSINDGKSWEEIHATGNPVNMYADGNLLLVNNSSQLWETTDEGETFHHVYETNNTIENITDGFIAEDDGSNRSIYRWRRLID
jgi:hypothetical protein